MVTTVRHEPDHKRYLREQWVEVYGAHELIDVTGNIGTLGAMENECLPCHEVVHQVQ